MPIFGLSHIWKLTASICLFSQFHSFYIAQPSSDLCFTIHILPFNALSAFPGSLLADSLLSPSSSSVWAPL